MDLLTATVKRAVWDIRRSTNHGRRQDAWRFLWEIAPTIAQRLFREEGIGRMEAVAEEMTLKQVEGSVHEWQDRLRQATEALAQYENNLGQIALSSGVDNAAEMGQRLHIELKMAEAGLAGAQQQKDATRRREMAQRVVQMREQAAELEKKADEYATFLNEMGPKVEDANQQLYFLNNQISSLQRTVDDYEFRLKQGGAT